MYGTYTYEERYFYYTILNYHHNPVRTYFLLSGIKLTLPPFGGGVIDKRNVLSRSRFAGYHIASSGATHPLPTTDATHEWSFLPKIPLYRGYVYFKNSAFYVVSIVEGALSVISPYNEYIDLGTDPVWGMPLFSSLNNGIRTNWEYYLSGLACKISIRGSISWTEFMSAQWNSSGESYSGVEEFGARIGATPSNWLTWLSFNGWEEELGHPILVIVSSAPVNFPPHWSDTHRKTRAREISQATGVDFGRVLNLIPGASVESTTSPVFNCFGYNCKNKI